MPGPTPLSSYAALLAAAAGDPFVEHEVGPDLLAPPLALGGAVLYRRMTQLGFTGAVCLGPAPDVRALLRSEWRGHPGWAAERSITVEATHRGLLEDLGVRGLGEWHTMSALPGQLDLRPVPAGVMVERTLARDVARAFVGEHHTARWITPDPEGEMWLAVRARGTGELLGTGLAAYTPSGATRLTSIAIHRDRRCQGLGRLVTQALAEVGFERSPAVVLGVDQDNIVGRTLYAAMGFRLDHELVSGILPPAAPVSGRRVASTATGTTRESQRQRGLP